MNRNARCEILSGEEGLLVEDSSEEKTVIGSQMEPADSAAGGTRPRGARGNLAGGSSHRGRDLQVE